MSPENVHWKSSLVGSRHELVLPLTSVLLLASSVLRVARAASDTLTVASSALSRNTFPALSIFMAADNFTYDPCLPEEEDTMGDDSKQCATTDGWR